MKKDAIVWGIVLCVLFAQSTFGQVKVRDPTSKRVIIFRSEQDAIRGALVEISDSFMVVLSSEREVRVPITEISRIILTSDPPSHRGAIYGAVMAGYAGAFIYGSTLENGGYIPSEQFVEYLAVVLPSMALGAGIGFLFDSGSDQVDEYFEFTGTAEERAAESARLVNVVTDEPYDTKVHITVQGSHVYSNIPSIDLSGSNPYENTSSLSMFNLFRKVQATCSVFPEMEAGIAVVWFGEPAQTSYNYETLSNGDSKGANTYQSFDATGINLVAIYKPLYHLLDPRLDLNVGGGLGTANIDYGLTTIVWTYPQSGPGTTTISASGYSDHSMVGYLFGQIEYEFSLGLSVGLVVDHVFGPSADMPAVPEEISRPSAPVRQYQPGVYNRAQFLTSLSISPMIGQIISHCRILEKLGEGGMGVVYKAHDLTLDRVVALKFLPHRSSSEDAEQIRFQQEAKAAANLNHPNVCTIYRFDEHDGQQFIEMEYVDGGSLRKLTPVENFDKALGYAIQIGEALQEAHSKGVVHRDVKTENIMVNSKYQIKVMDFGLAKLKGSLKLTKASSTVGTIAYMAPEQIQGLDVDGRSDIFSFGVVLFEMLTGLLPFRGDHEAAMMYSILNEEPESVQKSRPDLPAELDRIIRRAVEKDPEDRYQHVDDMVSELRRMKKQSTRISRTTVGRLPTQPSAVKVRQNDDDVPGSDSNHRWNARTRRYVAGGVVSVVLLAVLIGYVTFFDKRHSINSIAVLPFTNIDASLNTEYLSDGITESLINKLSQISTLTVMSRSAVFHYKGTDIDPQKAGKELGVNAVLAGRIVQRDDKLQISVELVDVSNNSHVWGERYDQSISDLQAVQEDISREISRKLSLKLAGEDEKKLERRATENSEAYQLYLKGRYHWNKRLPKDLNESIRLYEEALVKDPGYAEAYAGLSDSYIILGDYNLSPPRETYPKAKAAAQKALLIDPDNASAHTSLAYALMRSDRDWSSAEKEFHLAIQLGSNSAQVHSWYALYLSLRGRDDEAMAEVKKALALDPLSAIIRTDAGMVFYFSRKYDLALVQIGKALEIDPAFIVAKIPLGGAYVQMKMYPEAIKAFEYLNMGSVVGTSAANPVPIAALAYVYGVSGRKDDALTYIELLHEQTKEQVYVAPYWMAVAYAGLGNVAEEIRWLQKAYDEGDGNLIFLGVDPIFDRLHADKRFHALLKDVGLEK